MRDDVAEQDWLQFGVAAALAKKYAADEHLFLEQLASMLQAVLPADTKLERQGGLFSPKTVRRVSVTLDNARYALEADGRRPLSASRSRIVRGIALKTEPLPVQDLLSELGSALAERAKASEATRTALSRFVGPVPG